MLSRIRYRNRAVDPLDALLDGDILFYKANDDDDGDTSGGSGGSSQEDDDDGDGDGDGSGSGDGDGDGDNDDAEARIAAADKKARKANREAKNLRDRLKVAEAKLAEGEKPKPKDGDGDASTEAKAEIAKLRQDAADADARAVKAEARIKRTERERLVTSVARELKFADPDIILAMVESGRVDGIDDDDLDDLERADVKTALKALAKKKPAMLSDESSTEGDRRSGANTNPRKRDRVDEAIDKLPLGERAHARLTRAFSSSK